MAEPVDRTFSASGARWETKLPDGEVGGEYGENQRRLEIVTEGPFQWKGTFWQRGGRRKRRGKREGAKEERAREGDNRTDKKKMDKRIITFPTVKTS